MGVLADMDIDARTSRPKRRAEWGTIAFVLRHTNREAIADEIRAALDNSRDDPLAITFSTYGFKAMADPDV